MSRQVVSAEICLYGRSAFGWLAQSRDGRMSGDGELRHPGLTDAVFAACRKLSEMGVTGTAKVFEPSGQRVALVSISSPCWYGDLEWRAAPVYQISAEDLVEASLEGRR